jgi:hypothetical protein
VKTQIKASFFFFSLLDLNGSRSTPGAVLLPSSSTAAHRRREVPGLARVTHEEHGHRWRGNAAAVAWWWRRESDAVTVGREREREGRGESKSEKLTTR